MAKLIFLPHCLRNPDCPGRIGPKGYDLLNCGRCNVCDFKKEAESKGYNVFIVPGASLIKKILLEYPEPELVIGVACDVELKEGLEMMKKQKIKAKAVKLLKDGCVATEVDWEKLKAML